MSPDLERNKAERLLINSSHDASVRGTWRVHGGPNLWVDSLLVQNGQRVQEILDFSVNLNYCGPSPRVKKAVASSAPWHYPHLDYPLLKAKIRQRHPQKEITLGNGAADLMWTIAQSFVGRGYFGAIVEPTFCEFRAGWYAALRTAGWEKPEEKTFEWRTQESEGFRLDLRRLESWLKDLPKPLVVYICNPNSPTGTLFDPRELESLVDKVQDTWILLDEAFWTLSDMGPFGSNKIPWDHQVTSPRLLQLRSMTKDHALAGLRLGYVAAASEVSRWIEAQRPPWMINTVAYNAGLAALDDDKFLNKSWEQITHDRQVMVQLLVQNGFEPLPTSTVFMALKVGSAEFFHRQLLDDSILIRSMASYGLPEYVRLCIRPEKNVRTLVQALSRARSLFHNL